MQFFLALPVRLPRRGQLGDAPDDFANLAALEHASGGLTFPGLQNDPPTLMGRPVFMDASLPTPAASAKSLLVGDFRLGYGVRRVRDISIKRQVELHATAARSDTACSPASTENLCCRRPCSSAPTAPPNELRHPGRATERAAGPLFRERRHTADAIRLDNAEYRTAHRPSRRGRSSSGSGSWNRPNRSKVEHDDPGGIGARNRKEGVSKRGSLMARQRPRGNPEPS